MWEENKHPRASDGKFTEKGGTSAEHKRLQELGIEKRQKYIELPKQEYAELCSAIRTRFGNTIPKISGILYKNDYYIYNYDKIQEKIICTQKISILGNEDKINYWEDYFDV